MKQSQRIIDSFRTNNITSVLLIDDAYDPPAFNEEIGGQLADYLDSDVNRAICSEFGIAEDTLESAISAATGGVYGSDDLKKVHDFLYEKFVQEPDDKYDPGEVFKLHKEPNLQALRPLYNLLCSCVGDENVYTAGLTDGAVRYHNIRPQVLFVDYYLSDDVPPAGDVDQYRRTSARKESIRLLSEIIDATREEEIPAIILMSSYGNLDTNKYRHDTESEKILSLRFQFLNKGLVRQTGNNFSIEHPAADALLDTSQGYHFGIVLQQALSQWQKGAEAALKNFKSELGDLDIKDIAYLLRFKLREEGQQLSEYLQWFFSECLKGFIDKKVDWRHESFTSLDSKDNLDKSIEGAFDGPTKKIAEFFHLVRVDSHRIETRGGYQLGDLYADKTGNKVRAVVTPDCDLIERKGSTKAQNVLTIGGELSTFNKDGAAADDFFLRKERPYSVMWKPKDIELFPIGGKDQLHASDKYDFLGTLRPLYALEMQHRVIEDLSRVGLPVAPALGISAAVTVWIRKKNGFDEIEINQHSRATLIPSRSGQESYHIVLLQRSFINALIDQLDQIQKDELSKDDATSLNIARSKDGRESIYSKFLKKGVEIDKNGPVGIKVILGEEPNSKKSAPWLQIVMKVPDELMEAHHFTDPLQESDENTESESSHSS